RGDTVGHCRPTARRSTCHPAGEYSTLLRFADATTVPELYTSGMYGPSRSSTRCHSAIAAACSSGSVAATTRSPAATASSVAISAVHPLRSEFELPAPNVLTSAAATG